VYATARSTSPYGAFFLRLALGVVFIAHGWFKLFTLGPDGTAAFFAAHGFPGWTAVPVGVLEVVGGLLLVTGTFTRVVSLVLVPVLLGAITVHWGNGWSFTATNGGWEYPGFLVASLLTQAVVGDGPFALRPWRAAVARSTTATVEPLSCRPGPA
jgi:putative oxidoreductase